MSRSSPLNKFKLNSEIYAVSTSRIEVNIIDEIIFNKIGIT